MAAIKSRAKEKLVDLYCSRLLQALIRPFVEHNAVIFVIHRFSSEEHGTRGISPALVSEYIDYLHNSGRQLVSLEQLLASAVSGKKPISNAVVFTIDDGFEEQGEFAEKVFSSAGVPVALCVITQLCSQHYWLAESRISYIFENCAAGRIDLAVDGRLFEIELADDESRRSAAREVILFCKGRPLVAVERLIDELIAITSTVVPDSPPMNYRGLTWARAEQLLESGVEFVSHSRTHPGLLQEDDSRMALEIRGSREELNKNIGVNPKVFCYPTGRPGVDFGRREISHVKSSGYTAALSTDSGYVNLKNISDASLFAIPRFSLPNNISDFKQIIHHGELAKNKLGRSVITDIRDQFGSLSGFSNFYINKLFKSVGVFRRNSNINWPNVRRLIFVCHGNICRSALAHHYSRQLGLDADSYGLACPNGDPVNPRMSVFARQAGVEIDGHRTKNFNSYEECAGDLIIVMTPGQLKGISSHDFKLAEITMLGLWATEENPYLHDPYSASQKFFDRCGRTIIEACDSIKKKIDVPEK